MPIPYDGEQLTLHDPNGTELPVHAWGNQFAAVFETLEGYTVVQDPDSGYWHYATLSPDEQELLPATDRSAPSTPPGSTCPGISHRCAGSPGSPCRARVPPRGGDAAVTRR